MEYLALEGGPPSFTRGFTGTVLLWNLDHNGGYWVRLRDCHPVLCAFPDTSATVTFVTPDRGPQPRTEVRFGLFRFRSPLLAESLLISFPAAT